MTPDSDILLREQQDAEVDPPKYAVNARAFTASGKSFPYAIFTRMSERGMAQVGGSADTVPSPLGTPSEYMRVIASVCSKEPDYLLPGTPITEAVFRLLLANGNRPLTLQEIQERLATAWASVIYLKNLSDDVVLRMLDEPDEYFIGRV